MTETSDHEQARARAYVRELLAATGWTPTELARRAGLAPSTLNRFLNAEVKHTLSQRSLSKIEKVAGRVRRSGAIPDLIAQLEAKAGEAPAGAEREALLRTVAELERIESLGYAMRGWDHATAGSMPLNMHYVMARGTVEAGVWREAAEWPEEDWFPVGVAGVERYDELPQFALVVRGPSMNLIYPEGSVLICVAFLHLGRGPRHGERVVVEHRKSGFVEATVKEYAVEAGERRLYARSDSPRHAGAVEIPREANPAESQDGEIRITALVIASIRPEPAA